ncbi:MAG: bifunctional DNA-formamidopyrimidine glycosylase/DNA-(apurinic or apyrimidinic site) lyase [Lentisphaeria bacterium]|nr:bifunctional DNA-formamidopyrimidine glycosylase/DNA-(apurinic or apyrimidinic site) lyase [Lentisphaeria bacterium]
MPELPEVQNVCDALRRVLPGRRITGVRLFSPALRTSLLPLETADLPGRFFTDVRRRAKYIIADLDDGRSLLMHLGMSGVIRVEDAELPRRRHEHVFILLDDGRAFRFECPRRFSLLECCLLEGREHLPQKLLGLGIEPFSRRFSAAYLAGKAAGRSVPVKNFIMDNAVVTGIGNIYAAETLFAAGIHPARPAGEVSHREWRQIVRHARRILARAVELGGTSISDFLNVDGSESRFAQELNVYGSCGRPCPVCGTILQTVKLGGRSSCFCPECQK